MELVNFKVGNAAHFLATFDAIASEMLEEMNRGNMPGELQRQRNPPMTEASATRDKAPPPALLRRHETVLLPPASCPIGPLRGLRAPDIGSLVRVRGMVTRSSDVKPLMEVLTYTCESCGCEIYHDVSKRQDYLPLSKCTSEQCNRTGQNGRLFAQTRGSKFIKYQELRLQELPSNVPVGHVPRSLSAHCRGELTRRCAPGDIVTVCGIFLPTKLAGVQSAKAGLISDTFLEIMSIEKDKKSYNEIEGTKKSDTLIDEIADS